MTKKLEELFNLPDAEEIEAESSTIEPEEVKEVKNDLPDVKSVDEGYQQALKYTKDLPAISELNDLSEKELDDLCRKAQDAYENLMDLGMNVEVRYAARIFEVASSMLNNAISAKTAKVDKKLKAVDLQLKKLKIDNDSKSGDAEDIMNGDAFVITDRNELLKKLGQKE